MQHISVKVYTKCQSFTIFFLINSFLAAYEIGALRKELFFKGV